MAVIKLYDLARMTTATATNGTITLGSAVSGFLTFAQAGISDGETVRYAIRDGAGSEVGTGVYTASGTTLTRGPIKSTNSNAAIVLSGTAEVAITAIAEDFRQLYLDDGAVGTPALTFGANANTGLYRIGANNIGVAANGAKVLDIGTGGLGIASTTAASSTTTGALTVAGGVGVAGNIYTGGNLVFPGVGNTISFANGSGVIASGNKAIAPNGNIADAISYGIGIYRDNTIGCTAIVLFDGGNSPVILGQTSSNLFVLQGADPGPGGSKWVVLNSPSLGAINSRFTGSQTLWRCLIGVGVSVAA